MEEIPNKTSKNYPFFATVDGRNPKTITWEKEWDKLPTSTGLAGFLPPTVVMFQPQIFWETPLVPSRDFCRPVGPSVTKGKRPKSVSHTLSFARSIGGEKSILQSI